MRIIYSVIFASDQIDFLVEILIPYPGMNYYGQPDTSDKRISQNFVLLFALVK